MSDVFVFVVVDDDDDDDASGISRLELQKLLLLDWQCEQQHYNREWRQLQRRDSSSSRRIRSRMGLMAAAAVVVEEN